MRSLCGLTEKLHVSRTDAAMKLFQAPKMDNDEMQQMPGMPANYRVKTVEVGVFG